MRVFFIILVLIEMFLVMLLCTPAFVDRHDLASAVAAYSRDPSQEHLRELEAQQRITQQIRHRITALVIVMLVANSCGLFLVARRLSKKPSNKSLQATATAPFSSTIL